MIKGNRDELIWRIDNAINQQLYNPWVSEDMQNYIRRIVAAAAYEIADSIYTQQELELKAEQILLDEQQD